MVIMIAVVVIAEEMPRGPDACSLIYATACRQCEIVKSPVLLLIAGSVTSATSGHQRAGKQARAGRQAGRRIVVRTASEVRHMPSCMPTDGAIQQRHES